MEQNWFLVILPVEYGKFPLDLLLRFFEIAVLDIIKIIAVLEIRKQIRYDHKNNIESWRQYLHFQFFCHSSLDYSFIKN